MERNSRPRRVRVQPWGVSGSAAAGLPDRPGRHGGDSKSARDCPPFPHSRKPLSFPSANPRSSFGLRGKLGRHENIPSGSRTSKRTDAGASHARTDVEHTPRRIVIRLCIQRLAPENSILSATSNNCPSPRPILRCHNNEGR